MDKKLITTMKQRPCELCKGDAAVFCSSDAAFLCWTCDAKVHEANFLVARHLRHYLCSNCRNFTGQGFSGVGFHPFPATCPSCLSDSAVNDLDSLSSSSNSSDCISSTTSPAKEYSCGSRDALSLDSFSSAAFGKRRRRGDYWKAEGIFVNWCDKLGVGVGVVVRMARRALRVCMERWTVLPFRVSLAASMWLGLRLSGEKSVHTWHVLKRLEEISGVPAKVIVAAASKLERALRGERQKHRRRLELKEGWAES
ncbi:hypothetical protein CDL12_03383 [Handroanthus impetiginosus]|uniref:B box-type domain-containing protein n=1 Tax=Handroanthus impetiginosus TaxID=429701 RepID=A0A2G9I279_9LAMI|nr:hypothetical protein CDL12_03383 [Handroanthus impetiginosus]